MGCLWNIFTAICLLDDDFPAIVTSQSYLELFQKDQLLYLTLHCRTDITEYDPDTVYIIDAVIDKKINFVEQCRTYIFGKSQEEWYSHGKVANRKTSQVGGFGSKNFPIDQIINILLDIRYTGDWKKTLQHVPNQKLESREYKLQKKIETFALGKDGKSRIIRD